MIHFFQNEFWITVGVIVTLFWIIVIILLSVEIFDVVTERLSSTDQEEEDNL